jgi:hypothetical protein
MIRREFIALLGGVAAWPFAARVQQGERVRRIGVLMSTSADDAPAQARLAAFARFAGVGLGRGPQRACRCPLAGGGSRLKLTFHLDHSAGGQSMAARRLLACPIILHNHRGLYIIFSIFRLSA